MKKIVNSKGFFAFLVLLVAANIVVFYFHKQAIKKNDVRSAITAAQHEFDQMVKADEGKSILLDSLSLLHDNGREAYSFDKERYLIVRFSELNCETCVQNIFSLLQKDSGIDTTRIMLFVDYKSEAFLKTFLRVNLITYPVFRYYTDKSVLDTDNRGYPYVFIADRNGRLHDFFIPVKENPQRTLAYLGRIKKLL